MAYISTKLRSILLQRTMNVELYFPTDLPRDIVPRVQGVVTLLAGYAGSGADWMHWSAAPRYAADNGLILVAPDCDNSFYTDMASGGAYYTYLTEELPALLGSMFRLPEKREENFIAGVSMGGYGALLAALTHPERYAGAACFSGVVDPDYMATLPGMEPLFTPVFGSPVQVPERYDLTALAAKVARLSAAQQPRLLLTAGAQDEELYGILSQNRAFAAKLTQLGLAHCRAFSWDGNHEWKFWDRSMVLAVDDWLQNGYANQKHHDWQCALHTL